MEPLPNDNTADGFLPPLPFSKKVEFGFTGLDDCILFFQHTHYKNVKNTKKLVLLVRHSIIIFALELYVTGKTHSCRYRQKMIRTWIALLVVKVAFCIASNGVGWIQYWVPSFVVTYYANTTSRCCSPA